MSAGPSRTDASAEALRGVRRSLLTWYADAQRDFPWRRTRDPWAVLVSEVMLQQTQASRVAERFLPFMQRFPTPSSMTRATEADVLAAWSGLGYNRRALGLRRAAAVLERDGWPVDVAGLQALPGVGPYTARAVAALAFGRPVGAVDTNVRRWLVRRFGLPADVAVTELQRLASALAVADAAITPDGAAAWMHASMEFGAGVCTARAPRCGGCPIARGCPSRDRPTPVPVARQAAFAGSDRQARGELLRALSASPGHQLPLASALRLISHPHAERLLAGLASDGLAHRSGDRLVLGGAGDQEAAATIGP